MEDEYGMGMVWLVIVWEWGVIHFIIIPPPLDDSTPTPMHIYIYTTPLIVPIQPPPPQLHQRGKVEKWKVLNQPSGMTNPDDHAEFWDELWKIPSSAEEVFELISPRSARFLRDERFDNLATLFTQATARLNYVSRVNCVRVLTRVLPFLLEKGK